MSIKDVVVWGKLKGFDLVTVCCGHDISYIYMAKAPKISDYWLRLSCKISTQLAFGCSALFSRMCYKSIIKDLQHDDVFFYWPSINSYHERDFSLLHAKCFYFSHLFWFAQVVSITFVSDRHRWFLSSSLSLSFCATSTTAGLLLQSPS